MELHKIETHLHTSCVSRCGYLDPGTLAQAYHRAGYRAIAVTDHYNRITFDHLGIPLDSAADKIFAFLEGYRQLCAACRPYGIQVYKGAELRFDENENDYLLFGFRNALLRDPEAVFRMGLAAFARLARREGAVLIQAHPYRDKCTPADAGYLDGVEVFNSNPRHENRNDRAEAFAAANGLRRLAGSDCHQATDIAVTGIGAAELPGDSFAFTRLIRSGSYTLLCDK